MEDRIYIENKPILNEEIIMNYLKIIGLAPDLLLLMQYTAEQLVQNSLKQIYVKREIIIHSKNKNITCPFNPVHNHTYIYNENYYIHTFIVGYNQAPEYIKLLILICIKQLIKNELPMKELEFFRSHYIYQ
jgi:hypothetical protein